MQLRFATAHTSAEYVSRQAWRNATLARCPHHPYGGCSFTRHGTYARKTPLGTRIARWYCPDSHTTFSLLPDCLAARLPGTLDDLEAVVAVAEGAASLEAAANAVRSDPIGLPGAVRWLRRRIRLVQRCLRLVIGLLPERFSGCTAQIDFRERLGSDAVLMALRELLALQLPMLPTPLGFSAPAMQRGHVTVTDQQQMGPDPPGWTA